MLKHHLLLAVAAGLLTGCSPSDTSNNVQRGELVPACTWPASVTIAADAGGCSPQSLFDFCQVPSDSTAFPDGAVRTPDGGLQACSYFCSPTEYLLSCSAFPTSDTLQLQSPDTSLGCKVVPTPGLEVLWCCPCTP